MMISFPDYAIITGNMLEILPLLPRAKCVFADPPDNLGLKYDGYKDKISSDDYSYYYVARWLRSCVENADVVWFSMFYRYISLIYQQVPYYQEPREARLIIWRFTFGQHQKTDLGNGFRPIFRIKKKEVKLYPENIMIPSARQSKYNDKRANPDGRIPDDVWDFPRVCGTFKERRKWIPTQHPEALVERAILLPTQPGDLVIDPFLGSGTTLRVCQRLKRRCIGIDISPGYCEKVSEETKVPICKLIDKKGEKQWEKIS